MAPASTKNNLTVQSTEISSYQLSSLQKSGELAKVQPGLYSRRATSEFPDENAAREEHFRELTNSYRQRIAHASRRFPDFIVSHQSAALLHNLSLPNLDRQVWMTDSKHGSTKLVGIKRIRSVVPLGQTTVISGVPTTTLLRTVVDCARSMPAIAGLAVVDEALNRGLALEDMRSLNHEMDSKRGRAKARWLFEVALRGVESAMESRLRFILICSGYTSPQVQFHIRSLTGRDYYADIAFPELKVIFEYDGRIKYQTNADLLSEKTREDAIRLQGWKVVRVQASELRDPLVAISYFRRIANQLGIRLADPCTLRSPGRGKRCGSGVFTRNEVRVFLCLRPLLRTRSEKNPRLTGKRQELDGHPSRKLDGHLARFTSAESTEPYYWGKVLSACG